MAAGLVYCSGPLFCPEERAGMAALAGALERAGYETFLPQRDGLERHVMRFVNTPLGLAGGRAHVDRAIFALDVYQIGARCDVLVCNLNGRVPDEGAAVEAGVAFALGKPVVLYCSDQRSVFMGRHNAMLLGLAARPPVAEVRELAAAVADALRGTATAPAAPAGDLARALRQGERIWRVLRSWPVRGLGGDALDAGAAELLAALEATGGEERGSPGSHEPR